MWENAVEHSWSRKRTEWMESVRSVFIEKGQA